jgi:hypothetical protein
MSKFRLDTLELSNLLLKLVVCVTLWSPGKGVRRQLSWPSNDNYLGRF